MIAIIDLENETARTPLTPDYDARLENDLLKATMSRRHGNYYGFVKAGFETRRPKGASAIRFVQHVGATWSFLLPLLAPIGV